MKSSKILTSNKRSASPGDPPKVDFYYYNILFIFFSLFKFLIVKRKQLLQLIN